MKRSEMVAIIADSLFYRDMAAQHQFWYREEDKPLLEESEDKEDYFRHASMILTEIEKAGMCPVTEDHNGNLLALNWEPEDEQNSGN